MVKVNIRTLTHNFSSYMKRVKAGERVCVVERNIPIADIVPHNEHVSAGWKRPVKKVRLPKGVSLAEEVVRARKESSR